MLAIAVLIGTVLVPAAHGRVWNVVAGSGAL